MKYAIATLGCKVNQYETAALETLLRERGFSPTSDGDADAVIINTCAVTAESGRKSRQAVRRLKSENPNAAVVVCGCFSQVEPEALSALGADLVYGSGDRRGLADSIAALVRDGVSSGPCVDNPFKRMEFEKLPAGAAGHRTRAMLKIQDGCDNFCTYCVIPFARGRVRSLPLSDAAEAAAKLDAEGFREIVLTGIEIASYGKDLKTGDDLAAVTEAIISAAPHARVRLGSLEPTVVTEDFCRTLSASGRLCRHFHLSLQSGSDGVLRRMNRKYDTEGFMRAVRLLRESFPGCGLTADLITGFPGETEAEHRETLAFIRQCAFSAMHVFPYSVRPGTKAAAMPGQLSAKIKSARAHEAAAVAGETKRAYLCSCVGRSLPVLFERAEEGRFIGHADNYCLVSVPEGAERGLVRNVKITGVLGEMLVGEVV